MKRFEISSIDFQNNRAFDYQTLLNVISSRETPNWFSKFMYKILGEQFGSKPEFFNSDVFEQDGKRLSEYYQDNGYYDVNVSNQKYIDSAKEKARLTFIIREGGRSYIDSISYEGFDNVPDKLKKDLFSDRLIQQGQPYVKTQAFAEVSRIIDILANNGYPTAKFNPDKSFARHYLSTNNFMLNFYFDTGKEYRFGSVTVDIDPPRKDITEEIVLRQLDFNKDEVYSRKKKISSEQSINRLGLFETARVEHSIPPDSLNSDLVPIDIYLRPRPRNEVSPELILSDEGNTFNLGFGLGYTNRNFFGDARSFNIRTRIRTQDIQRWNMKEVFKGDILHDPTIIGAAEIQFQVLQPYLFSRSTSGSLTSTISAEKQSQYILSIFKNKLGFSNQFAMYTYGLFEWTLERVSPKIVQDTAQPAIVLQNLRQEDRPQFNSILTMTLQRDKTNDIFSPTAGFFNSITLEESGVLPKLLSGIRANLPFTQYYKIALLGRWYKDLTRTKYNIFALKLKTGYQDKYGESKSSLVSIPLNRRFFGGGSGSVRGWKARALGAMPDKLREFGGNFMFEGSTEMRINYFRGYDKFGFIELNNFWLVYFLDFGNVWSNLTDFKSKDIAAAAGIGLRYETFFGPFRIDYGFRLYDPSQPTGQQTVFQKKFFKETLSNAIFHFGIGHAF